MKTIYLVRHAKSSWSDPSLSDQKRPLNDRGLRNAPDMGRRLAEKAIRPGLIVCSPAKRAFTTATLIANEIAYPQKDILIDDRLYFDGISAMLDIIHKTDPALPSLMMVGHNPDMTTFLYQLSGYQLKSMKTCAIATISFDLHWSGIQFKSGRLLDYDYPKKPLKQR